MTEQWKPVAGYEGLYEVSDQGNVRSLPRPGKRNRNRVYGGQDLKPTPSGPPGARYMTVNLHHPGGRRTLRVHRLVAGAFLGPRPDGCVIRHLDGNSLNNRVGNLVYGTQSENILDAVRHGTHPEASRTHCDNGHEYTPDNTGPHPAGGRRCLACHRDQEHRRHERKRAA